MKIKSADVSVITPFFNDWATIDRCLESISQQTLPVKQIIIIDDCSEEPLSAVYITAHHPHIAKITTIIKNKTNQGASHSRNKGIAAATSKYMAFLDADDQWHPQKIEIQYREMECKNLKFSYHSYSSNNKTNIKPQEISHNLTKKINPIRFIFGNFICTPTVMVDRETFINFDERLQRMEDYKCWIENNLIHDIHHIKSTLCFGFKKPIGDSGLSGSIKKMHNDCKNALNILYKERKISLLYYIIALSIENTKYIFR